MAHEMIRIDGVWGCVECPRRLLFTDTHDLKVLEQGDFNVMHFGSVGDISLTGLRVEGNT